LGEKPSEKTTDLKSQKPCSRGLEEELRMSAALLLFSRLGQNRTFKKNKRLQVTCSRLRGNSDAWILSTTTKKDRVIRAISAKENGSVQARLF